MFKFQQVNAVFRLANVAHLQEMTLGSASVITFACAAPAHLSAAANCIHVEFLVHAKTILLLGKSKICFAMRLLLVSQLSVTQVCTLFYFKYLNKYLPSWVLGRTTFKWPSLVQGVVIMTVTWLTGQGIECRDVAQYYFDLRFSYYL